MNYIFHILIMICIYTILSLSSNLLIGYTGIFSICSAAFYGIGAYTTAISMMRLNINFFPSMIIGILVSFLISYVVSLPSLRLKGDYFVLASIGFQVIIFSILYNWVSLTKGPYGIPGIPKPNIFGIKIDSIPLFLIFVLIITILLVYFFRTLYSSPFGRALKGIREDEIIVQASGRNTYYFKSIAFGISSGVSAIAGSIFATYVTYIDPTSFTIDESIFILSIVLVGGSGNILGPIVGSILMIIIPEILRFLGIPSTVAPNIRQMIYGVILIVLMRKRPQGIAGEYKME